MYTDVAGLRVTLEMDGYEQFEAACECDVSAVRELLLSEDGVEEAIVLDTCQRYELYTSGPRARDALANCRQELEIPAADDRLLTGVPVVEHLFRVTAGLESGVLGEDEIIGQFREAYRRASEAGALGGTLDTIALKALRVGERARTETVINEGVVSLGSITVDRITDEVTALEDCTILVVGAGDVAQLVAKSLDRRDAGSIRIANRTLERAETVADSVGGDAVALQQLSDAHLADADVLVSATGADGRIFTAEELSNEELLVLDLANPRDVDPAVDDHGTVRLVRIDELLNVRDAGLEQREAAIPAVEAIIEAEIDRLDEQLRAEQIDDALNQIYSRSHELREAEFDDALARLERAGEPLTETQKQVMADFSEAVINKLLHPKTAALRQAAATGDRETVDAWLTLFDQESSRRHEEDRESDGQSAMRTDTDV